MPLPVPTEAEAKPEFITRCMGDDQAIEDNPDQAQRAAVCETQWNNAQPETEGEGKAATPEGTWAYCICKPCGYSIEHTAGAPCADTKCPTCGAALTPSNEEAEAKAVKALAHNSTLADTEPDWGTVDKTKLPDNAHADFKARSYPHHFVQGGGAPDEDGRWTTGTMYLHRGGLSAALAAAAGARSGEEAPAAIQAHLKAHADTVKPADDEKSGDETLLMSLENEADSTTASTPSPENAKHTTCNYKVASVDRDERTAVFTISSDHVDRDGEVVLPKGAKLENYQRNPVVLYGHDYSSLPVAKALWIKGGKEDGRSVLISKAKFASTEYANDVFDLVADGFLKTSSIGFIPDDMMGRAPTDAEVKANPEWSKARRVFDEWELLEWSIVPVPSNPHALARAMMKGRKVPHGFTLTEAEEIEDADAKPEKWAVNTWEPDAHEATCHSVERFVSDSFTRQAHKIEGARIYISVSGMTQPINRQDGTKIPGERILYKVFYPVDDWTADTALLHAVDSKASGFLADSQRVKHIENIVHVTKVHEVKILPPIKPDDSTEYVRVITSMKDIRKAEIARMRGKIIY